MTEPPIFFARPGGVVHARRCYEIFGNEGCAVDSYCGVIIDWPSGESCNSSFRLTAATTYIENPGPATCRKCLKIKAKKGDA